MEKAVNYLRDVGKLWVGNARNLQREFVQEVFQNIIIDGPQVTAIAPKSIYSPLFVLDRRERFAGVHESIPASSPMCSLAPGRGLEPLT